MVSHERPRYVERRVVVVERPAVMYRAAPAYAPNPAPNLGAIGGAIVGVAAGSVLGAFVGERLVNGY